MSEITCKAFFSFDIYTSKNVVRAVCENSKDSKTVAFRPFLNGQHLLMNKVVIYFKNHHRFETEEEDALLFAMAEFCDEIGKWIGRDEKEFNRRLRKIPPSDNGIKILTEKFND